MIKTYPTRHKARGLARFRTITWLRRAVQLYFVLFLTNIAVQKAIVGEDSPVFVPSPEAYSPFGGFEGLYKFVTSSGAFIAHTHWSNIVLFAGVVLVTLVTKSAFCGWICPFGTLQEWLRTAGKRLGLSRRSLPPRIDRPLRYLKYVVLAWATFGAAIFGVMVFRDIDPFHALIALTEVGFASSSLVLVMTLGLSLFIERPWCKYACPLGALIGVLGHLSLVKVERDAGLCTNCKLCDRLCPMQVPVASAERVGSAECNNCLICTDICPKGALEPKQISLQLFVGKEASNEV